MDGIANRTGSRALGTTHSFIGLPEAESKSETSSSGLAKSAEESFMASILAFSAP
ncbi:hypothetical protein [Xanthomonas theicola]|uniref:hypothetical protein n=1 Tax=Xanthomonas theicola TaxID=56464 RepID=UPI001B808C95|nr:hypothetical protein [Xanthomonas theicola]